MTKKIHKSIDSLIRKAVEDKEEFALLDDYHTQAYGEIMSIEAIDMVLDYYNYQVEYGREHKLFAKYNSVVNAVNKWLL